MPGWGLIKRVCICYYSYIGVCIGAGGGSGGVWVSAGERVGLVGRCQIKSRGRVKSSREPRKREARRGRGAGGREEVQQRAPRVQAGAPARGHPASVGAWRAWAPLRRRSACPAGRRSKRTTTRRPRATSPRSNGNNRASPRWCRGYGYAARAGARRRRVGMVCMFLVGKNSSRYIPF